MTAAWQEVDPKGSLGESKPVGVALSNEQLRDLYRLMALSRRVDRQAINLTRQGALGVFASSRGQEAAQVGAVFALGDEDWLFPSYRDTVGTFARGIVTSGGDPASVGRHGDCVDFAAIAGADRHSQGAQQATIGERPDAQRFVDRTRGRDPAGPVDAHLENRRDMHSRLNTEHRVLRWTVLDCCLQRRARQPVDRSSVTAGLLQSLLQCRDLSAAHVAERARVPHRRCRDDNQVGPEDSPQRAHALPP